MFFLYIYLCFLIINLLLIKILRIANIMDLDEGNVFFYMSFIPVLNVVIILYDIVMVIWVLVSKIFSMNFFVKIREWINKG